MVVNSYVDWVVCWCCWFDDDDDDISTAKMLAVAMIYIQLPITPAPRHDVRTRHIVAPSRCRQPAPRANAVGRRVSNRVERGSRPASRRDQAGSQMKLTALPARVASHLVPWLLWLVRARCGRCDVGPTGTANGVDGHGQGLKRHSRFAVRLARHSSSN